MLGFAIGAGTAAALVSGEQVAADDLELGASKVTTERTGASYIGAADAGVGFMFQSGNNFTVLLARHPAALAGWTSRAEQPSGVFGYTDQPDGYGVVGVDEAKTTRGSHAGVFGESRATVGGTGVRGRADSGVGVSGSGRVAAFRGSAENYGVLIDNSRVGVAIRGASGAALLLDPTVDEPSSPKAPPPERTDAHERGELDVDRFGALWFCTASGTPGTWQRIGGPDAAGAFHPVTPTRVYDSRITGTPGAGRYDAGTNRPVSVKDGRDLLAGSVTVADLVPAGATAISFNVTATNTTAPSFLSVTPGDAASNAASSLNWSGPGISVANGTLVKLDDDRQVKIFAGPGGTFDAIIDVTGYYL